MGVISIFSLWFKQLIRHQDVRMSSITQRQELDIENDKQHLINEKMINEMLLTCRSKLFAIYDEIMLLKAENVALKLRLETYIKETKQSVSLEPHDVT